MTEVRSAGGLAPTDIQGTAQSPDGFLWLANDSLYCFDGIGFEPIPLEGGDGSQALQVASPVAAPNDKS